MTKTKTHPAHTTHPMLREIAEGLSEAQVIALSRAHTGWRCGGWRTWESLERLGLLEPSGKRGHEIPPLTPLGRQVAEVLARELGPR